MRLCFLWVVWLNLSFLGVFWLVWVTVGSFGCCVRALWFVGWLCGACAFVCCVSICSVWFMVGVFCGGSTLLTLASVAWCGFVAWVLMVGV